ncbi:dNTP triphosphohydrolase [Pasteurellaceae bacterium LIM206]|nr:dNTP triphosphohydrolase [Pasteurellaceae bacterium LIM206]
MKQQLFTWNTDGLLSDERQHNGSDRDYFESDYKRIVTSPAFRRLQDKTQVFPLERNDFVRTRLTHSIEVAAIANQLLDAICKNKYIPQKGNDEELKKSFDEFVHAKDIIFAILESASALHDIGNPPFGHFGEDIIQQWFKRHFPQDKTKLAQDILAKLPQQVDYSRFAKYLNDFYEFEGNAQALRIITQLDENVAGCGMNLTYATINTIIKYTRSSTEMDKRESDKLINKKIGYFLSEKDVFNTVTSVTKVKQARHPLTFILEAADDIAYITADIEDAIKKELFKFSEFQEKLIDCLVKLIIKPESSQSKSIPIYKKFITKIKDSNDIEIFNDLRNFFILGASFIFCKKYKEIMSGGYNSDLFDDYDGVYSGLYSFLKQFAVDNIFNSKDILKLEIAGNEVLGFLLNKFIFAVLPYEDLDAGKIN